MSPPPRPDHGGGLWQRSGLSKAIRDRKDSCDFGEQISSWIGMIPWCHFASQHAKWLPQGASSWTVRAAQPLWRWSLRSKRKVNRDLPRRRSDLQMSPMCLLKEENKAVRVRGDVCVNLLVLTHHKKPSPVAMATKCQGWVWGWKQVMAWTEIPDILLIHIHA